MIQAQCNVRLHVICNNSTEVCCYLRCRLESQGIVLLGITLSCCVCVSTEPLISHIDCTLHGNIVILSGRYLLNISDTLLTGEFHQWKEGELTAVVHKPGLLLSIWFCSSLSVSSCVNCLGWSACLWQTQWSIWVILGRLAPVQSGGIGGSQKTLGDTQYTYVVQSGVIRIFHVNTFLVHLLMLFFSNLVVTCSKLIIWEQLKAWDLPATMPFRSHLPFCSSLCQMKMLSVRYHTCEKVLVWGWFLRCWGYLARAQYLHVFGALLCWFLANIIFCQC